MTRTVEISRSFWVELETPYGIIDENWDRYKQKLERYVTEDYRVSKDLLKAHWCLERDLNNIPYERGPALSHILDDDMEYGKNILCIYRFVSGKNIERIESCFDRIEDKVRGDDFERLYQQISESGNKDAMVAMIQFFDPNVLRDILGLQYCYGRKPQLIRYSESAFDNLDSLKIDKVADALGVGSESYRPWHNFTHEEKFYVLIKRRLGDEVERQVDQNLEEEPAEFVVLLFSDMELMIFSEKKRIASKSLRIINEMIEQTFKENIDDEEIDEDMIEKHQFEDEGDGLSFTELKSAIGLARDLEDNTDLVLKGIDVSDSNLPNSPEILLKTNRGITKTLDWFEERDVNLLNHPDDVKNLIFMFEGRDFKLLPKEMSGNGEQEWIFRYDSKYPSEEEREEFESQIREFMNVDVRFEKI
ncbi:hypothetical protein ACFQL7_13160 [Halocatena marina]|uniref:Uncharacterized protein n=2 Tax=Halocatena marina TaxID=2934937 RepID=A0ABD5YRC9_9EURY